MDSTEAFLADQAGGLTYNPRTGVVRQSGYALPIHPGRTLRLEGPPTPAEFEHCILRHQDAFDMDPEAALHVHADADGNHYVHVVLMDPDFSRAIAKARQRRVPWMVDIETGAIHEIQAFEPMLPADETQPNGLAAELALLAALELTSPLEIIASTSLSASPDASTPRDIAPPPVRGTPYGAPYGEPYGEPAPEWTHSWISTWAPDLAAAPRRSKAEGVPFDGRHTAIAATLVVTFAISFAAMLWRKTTDPAPSRVAAAERVTLPAPVSLPPPIDAPPPGPFLGFATSTTRQPEAHPEPSGFPTADAPMLRSLPVAFHIRNLRALNRIEGDVTNTSADSLPLTMRAIDPTTKMSSQITLTLMPGARQIYSTDDGLEMHSGDQLVLESGSFLHKIVRVP